MWLLVLVLKCEPAKRLAQEERVFPYMNYKGTYKITELLRALPLVDSYVDSRILLKIML